MGCRPGDETRFRADRDIIFSGLVTRAWTAMRTNRHPAGFRSSVWGFLFVGTFSS